MIGIHCSHVRGMAHCYSRYSRGPEADSVGMALAWLGKLEKMNVACSKKGNDLRGEQIMLQ